MRLKNSIKDIYYRQFEKIRCLKNDKYTSFSQNKTIFSTRRGRFPIKLAFSGLKLPLVLNSFGKRPEYDI